MIATAAQPNPVGRLARPEVVLAVLVLVLVGIDAFRIGFFADDLHFVDIARRSTLLESLSGRYGVWPWYRPLSREVFFEFVVAFGPSAIVVAHTIGVLCLAVTAWLVARIGAALFGVEAGWIAAALFVANGFTKFVTVWPSGFQDLLATALTLGAWLAQHRRRVGLALCLAALAPLAKETGFLVLPLLALHRVWLAPPTGRVRGLAALGAAMLAVAAVHVAARSTWPPHGPAPEVEVAPSYVWGVLGQVMGGFFTEATPIHEGAVVAAAAGFALAWVLLRHLRSRHGAEELAPVSVPVRDAFAYTAAAGLVGLVPLIAGHGLRLTVAHAYHAFPAVPWLALAVGGALFSVPRGARHAAVAAVVAWNAAGLAYRSVDLSVPDAWSFRRWDWPEAVRLTSVARRLGDDLRRELAQRPDSVVVLYREMPTGCMFQTQDGPATREALRDGTARAYWFNDPLADARGDRLVVLKFSTEDFHLHRAQWSSDEALVQAMNALMGGRAATARAMASYGESEDPRSFDRAYLRAAADLMAHGPEAYFATLRGTGVEDTLGDDPTIAAEPLIAISPPLGRALENVLRRPRSAAAHVALADTLLRSGSKRRAGLELRIAVQLDPARFDDRYRLAVVMADLGGVVEALAELRALAADAGTGAHRDRAHEATAAIEAGRPLTVEPESLARSP